MFNTSTSSVSIEFGFHSNKLVFQVSAAFRSKEYSLVQLEIINQLLHIICNYLRYTCNMVDWYIFFPEMQIGTYIIVDYIRKRVDHTSLQCIALLRCDTYILCITAFCVIQFQLISNLLKKLSVFWFSNTAIVAHTDRFRYFPYVNSKKVTKRITNLQHKTLQHCDKQTKIQKKLCILI